MVCSNNAINFQVASKLVSKADPKILEYTSRNNIEWKFIPSKSPNKGDLWESAVKSAKRYLGKVTVSTILMQEELGAMLSEIDAIVYSQRLGFTNNAVLNLSK